MNILTDALPSQVQIDGELYDLNTDSRVAIQIMQDFEDDELAAFEKNYLMLTRLYPVVPPNTEEAARQALRFLNGGDTPKEGEERERPVRVYSFSKDDKLIYAAFRQTHEIDLQDVDMHWWKFLALFMDLGAETTFSTLVGLRKRVKENKASDDDLKLAAELGDMFEVPEPDMRTWEEIKEDERKAALSAEFDRLLAGGA